MRRLAPLLLFVLIASFAANGSAQAPAPAASAGWPHTISRNGASVTIYQPQAEAWPERKTLTARAAVAITPAGQTTPMLGTIEISLQTSVDEATGIVHLSDPKLLTTHFPSLDTQQATALDAKLAAALPDMQTHSVPLASVLLSLNQTPVKSVELNNDPPRIFYADHPASLVVFDGDPVVAPAGKSGLSYAVNTNWEVFSIGGDWYLLNGGLWLKAPAATGPYAATTALPAAFKALPADANFADARKAIPARKPTAPVPAVFVSTVPAEIIVTDGAPKFSAVAGTSLKRVANTPNTLFFDDADAHFYVLIAGRWFSAPALDAAWTFATDKLPADFALIPPASPAAAVLPSVPGTVQSQEAVLKAEDSHHGDAQAERCQDHGQLRRPAAFRADPGNRDRARREHAVGGAEDRRQILRLRGRRVVRRGVPHGPVGVGGFDPAGDQDDSAFESGLQRDLRRGLRARRPPPSPSATRPGTRWASSPPACWCTAPATITRR